jgi:hypothetical protein
MAQRFKLKQSNALKHGVYSTIGLLPGESPAKFKKHQKDVIDEFRPNGPVEHDIVMTIARALWRKQNLATFQTAQLINFRYHQIIDEELKSRGTPSSHSQMFGIAAFQVIADLVRLHLLLAAADFVDLAEVDQRE